MRDNQRGDSSDTIRPDGSRKKHWLELHAIDEAGSNATGSQDLHPTLGQ